MARTKAKTENSVIKIVFNGLKTYFYNLDIFLKYLSFPVLGTILGAFILFLINYFYVINLEKLGEINPIFSNTLVILSLLIILTIPGFMIMIKAFVDYIIAYGALNSMCVLGTKRIEDVYSHKETIKRRFAPFCILILLLSLIYLVSQLAFPLFIIITIFLSLAIQVFSLEENSTPTEAIKRSFLIVKNNFWKTFWVLVLITIISYIIFPYLITWAIEQTPIFNILALPAEKYISLMPIKEINDTLNEMQINYSFDTVLIAQNIVSMTIMSAVTMYMLPFRCACMVNLYKACGNDFKEETEEENSPKTKSNKKETKKRKNSK